MFAATALITAGIYVAVMRLAEGDRLTAFEAVSPGLLPPMGLIFGLLVGFLAAQHFGFLHYYLLDAGPARVG